MKRRSRLRTAAATNQLQQPVEVEGLLQEVDAVQIVRAGLRLIERGEDDHRHVGQCRVVLLPPAELPPVHDRHHQIEQDDIGARRFIQVL